MLSIGRLHVIHRAALTGPHRHKRPNIAPGHAPATTEQPADPGWIKNTDAIRIGLHLFTEQPQHQQRAASSTTAAEATTKATAPAAAAQQQRKQRQAAAATAGAPTATAAATRTAGRAAAAEPETGTRPETGRHAGVKLALKILKTAHCRLAWPSALTLLLRAFS